MTSNNGEPTIMVNLDELRRIVQSGGMIPNEIIIWLIDRLKHKSNVIDEIVIDLEDVQKSIKKMVEEKP